MTVREILAALLELRQDAWLDIIVQSISTRLDEMYEIGYDEGYDAGYGAGCEQGEE